jgi:hypothetical protein
MGKTKKKEPTSGVQLERKSLVSARNKIFQLSSLHLTFFLIVS